MGREFHQTGIGEQVLEKQTDVTLGKGGNQIVDSGLVRFGEVHGGVVRAAEFDDIHVPEMEHNVVVEFFQIHAGVVDLFHRLDELGTVALENGLGNVEHELAVDDPQSLHHLGIGNLLVRCGGKDSVQQAQGVPDGTVGFLGNEIQPLGIHGKVFLGAQAVQMGGNLFQGNPPQVMALAPGKDGGRDLVDLGGGKDEFHMGRRLLQGLQQGVEGGRGEHVDFVDDVDFVGRGRGHVGDIFPQVPDLVHTVVGGSVDFKDIRAMALDDIGTDFTRVAGAGCGTAFAVQGLGQDSGNGGLPCSPGAGEKDGMGHTFGLNGIHKGRGNMALADDIVKGLGSIFEG